MTDSLPTKLKLSEAVKVVKLTENLFPKCAFLKYYPLVVTRALGSKLWDADGNEYVDFISGAAVFNIGHLHPDVVSSIEKQLKLYLAYPIVYFYNIGSCELAKKLIEITPGSSNKKVLFGFSGSDAMDMALMISRASTQRKYVVSFKGSFHGSTYLSMAASGIISDEHRELFQLPTDIIFADYPNPYRNPWNIDGYENPQDLSNTIQFVYAHSSAADKRYWKNIAVNKAPQSKLARSF
ncbi:MAG: aminotransferase class III-fold pyridoxal phosphate-dependent enzyme, partial [Desulfurococcaceae archaeon]